MSYSLSTIQEITPDSDLNRTEHKNHKLYSTPDSQDASQTIPIIYKEKKSKDPRIVLNEVVFSELARLYMLPQTTPAYHLVVDNNTITGLACHNIQYTINKNSNPRPFKSIQFSKETGYVFKDIEVNSTKDIPYKFLNELPQDIFSYLMKEKNKGTLSIDMDSLASTLVGKYFLEEDDLHRGNIGIYIVTKDGKPHIRFFNIDHDMMLCNSITSFFHFRTANLGLGSHAFNITLRDILNFPDLEDSENHYWPTRKRFMVRYGDNKIYALPEERAAFRNLKNDPEFKRYQWKRFLKSLITPDQLIHQALNRHLDPSNPEHMAEIHLITHSLHERKRKLEATLFCIPEFRDYLHSSQGNDDLQNLKQELDSYMCEIPLKQNNLIESIQQEVNQRVTSYLNFSDPLKKYPIPKEDSPLHMTIRLGNYHYEQSILAFGNSINQENAQGDRPIDIAAQLAAAYVPGSEKINPAKDPFAVMKHLISHGAQISPKTQSVLDAKGIRLEDYEFKSQYYDQEVKDYSTLKMLITQIGQDSYLSLKSKKIVTVNLVKQHIDHLSFEERGLFQQDLNGSSEKPIAPEYLFISQLRSSLWIIRMIRGLYGNSSTRMELNDLIEAAGSTPSNSP